MARDLLNPLLFDVAAWRLRGEKEKQAFVPAGGDPSQGGGDPSQGGGAPPPGAGAGPPPGMDPSAMGMPAGGAPPAMPPQQPGAAMPGQTGVPGQQPGGKVKVDPTLIYMELGRIRKLITHMMKSTGIDMPPDILDDSTVAQAVGGAQPMSQPIGQDSSSQQPPSLPAMGGQGAVQPIQPPDEGGAGGGQQNQGSVASLFQGPVSSDMNTFTQRMDALAALSRSLGRM